MASRWRGCSSTSPRTVTRRVMVHAQLIPGRWGSSVDTVAYALKHAGPGPLRDAVQRVVARARRTKVWQSGTLGPWNVSTIVDAVGA